MKISLNKLFPHFHLNGLLLRPLNNNKNFTIDKRSSNEIDPKEKENRIGRLIRHGISDKRRYHSYCEYARPSCQSRVLSLFGTGQLRWIRPDSWSEASSTRNHKNGHGDETGDRKFKQIHYSYDENNDSQWDRCNNYHFCLL